MEKKTKTDFLRRLGLTTKIKSETLKEVLLVMDDYADYKIKNMPVFRICSHCNTEFELTIANTLTERVSAFQNCTHCSKRNDTWISIRI